MTRGKWFLQTFLGVEPPQPPPDVPAFKERVVGYDRQHQAADDAAAMEMHRVSPTCASCHQIFEPMGIALENFDAVGAWRTLDEGMPIDATGILPDGTKVDGVVSAARRAHAVSGSVRARGHREADDVRARPRRGVSGHADGSRDRARCGRQQVPLLVARDGNREERCIPDESEGSRYAPQQRAAR